MTVKVISDLHSATGALKDQVAPTDTLLLLGDLVNLIDYATTEGILVEVYGRETVLDIIELRAQRRFEEARKRMAERREGLEQEMKEKFTQAMTRAYEEVFSVLPETTYMIMGNVDSPTLVKDLAPAHIEFPDGKVVEINGYRVGFVGGGLPTPLQVQGEIEEEEFNRKIDQLGPVEVICSHMPPAVPEMNFDILANRAEQGSSRLLEYIRDVQPAKALFGHIHHPLVSSKHIGKTHVVNCGYFRRTRRALSLK